MRTQRLAKELLYSLPCPVRFMGFESDTLRLARAGWGFSMREVHTHLYEYEMQLAMELGSGNQALYALSAPVHPNPADIHRALSDEVAYAEFFVNHGFDIQYMAPSMKFMVQSFRNSVGSPFVDQWNPVSMFPEERVEEIDIKQFRFFKQANPESKDLIVSPERVPELLDLILKCQAPQQKELRKRSESRENLQNYKTGEMFGAKPAHQVQAQIITLAV